MMIGPNLTTTLLRCTGLAALVLMASGLAAPATAADCDHACLTRHAERYMEALVAQDPMQLSWGEAVGFSENNIRMRIGDGAWATVNAASGEPLIVADPETGNVAWLGWVEEHGAPAYFGLRMVVEDGKIVDVETIGARKQNSDHFGDPKAYEPARDFGDRISRGDRESRERLVDIVDGYYSTLQQNDGVLFTHFDDDCQRWENGVSMTHGDDGPGAIAEGCEAQMKLGVYEPVTYVSHRRFPLVDPEHGIVVALAHRDYAADTKNFTTTDGEIREIEGLFYPMTYGVIEVFKIRDGAIADIETISTLLPYRMPSVWQD